MESKTACKTQNRLKKLKRLQSSKGPYQHSLISLPQILTTVLVRATNKWLYKSKIMLQVGKIK